MLKRIVACLVSLTFMFSLAGCATARKQQNLEAQGLRNQVSALEAQLQARDEEITNLRDALSRTSQEQESFAKSGVKKRAIAEVKSRPNVKQIQAALRSAGLNPGSIDGKMGRQTRDAIKSFQRENKLAADGRVGKQTWALLKEYLYKKIK